ncbi:MAG: magnesium transporter [Gammaproteobacteria bacterium]|nr:magnesium transporter [Gammaproteobacteria bacterium]
MAPDDKVNPDDVQLQLREVEDLLRAARLDEESLRADGLGAAQRTVELADRAEILTMRQLLDALHPANVAFILEALPLGQRLFVWELVKAERDGEILLEVSDAVRESLIETMDRQELKAVAETLEADELADLAPDLPRAVFDEVFQSLDAEEQAQLRAAMSYPEDTVGALMRFDMVSVREDITLEVVLRYLRRFEALPDHTDQLFVVDRAGGLRGLLSLESLLTNDPERNVGELMSSDAIVSFEPIDDAHAAAQAFERYDLVSAPVVDGSHRVIGRLTVDAAVDYIREESAQEILNQAGLREEEDVFAGVWDSVRNRWGWLAVNMVTAIVASRVIGLFEQAIESLVALAALMPIVAGIGGNSGNQTITMIVRAIAMGQVETKALARLLRKEISVALLNGLFWGSVLGLFAWWLYDSVPLGLVMAAAMMLNLLLAAGAGVLIPMARIYFRRDPALGSSVLITGLTDSGGFFIFLGLATLFLL